MRSPASRSWPRPIALLMAVLLLSGGGVSLAGQTKEVSHLADRPVDLDKKGVIRWKDDGKEVALFGANYVVTTASDYRAAGYVHADRKQMIDEDMAQFARMGWDGLRLTFWGDWEASDTAGNLIANDHLDLLDCSLPGPGSAGSTCCSAPFSSTARTGRTPSPTPRRPASGGISARDHGHRPGAIAAQVNYLRQILNHVNRYTGVALKDEPGHSVHRAGERALAPPDDLAGSIRYINTLTDAVRSTGCTQARVLQREPGLPDRPGHRQSGRRG